MQHDFRQKQEKLEHKLGFRWLSGVTLDEEMSARVADLYDQLYLAKYSKNNPRFTPLFHYVCSKLKIVNYLILLVEDVII